MSTLKSKLEEAVTAYNQSVDELQKIQQSLLVQQGSIQTLQALVTAEESEPAGDSNSEE